jgi:hypothetical protein
MSKWNFTVDDIMNCDPCDDYPRAYVEELFGGRETVTPEDILSADISAFDIGWIITNLAAKHNLDGLRSCYLKYTDYGEEQAAEYFDSFAAFGNRPLLVRMAVVSDTLYRDEYLARIASCFEE